LTWGVGSHERLPVAETVILDDFAELRKAELTKPLMDEIETQFTAGGLNRARRGWPPLIPILLRSPGERGRPRWLAAGDAMSPLWVMNGSQKPRP
jgi:hypothetical protein